MVRWDDYPGDLPAFERVQFRIVPDREKRMKLIYDGWPDEVELKAGEFCWYLNGDWLAENYRKGLGRANGLRVHLLESTGGTSLQ